MKYSNGADNTKKYATGESATVSAKIASVFKDYSDAQKLELLNYMEKFLGKFTVGSLNEETVKEYASKLKKEKYITYGVSAAAIIAIGGGVYYWYKNRPRPSMV